jgi:hypothetical protein
LREDHECATNADVVTIGCKSQLGKARLRHPISCSKHIDAEGQDAAIQASVRADERLEAGDIDGQREWLRIVKVTEERPGRLAATLPKRAPPRPVGTFAAPVDEIADSHPAISQ